MSNISSATAANFLRFYHGSENTKVAKLSSKKKERAKQDDSKVE